MINYLKTYPFIDFFVIITVIKCILSYITIDSTIVSILFNNYKIVLISVVYYYHLQMITLSMEYNNIVSYNYINPFILI